MIRTNMLASTPAARAPLPVDRVAGVIGIDQRIPEPFARPRRQSISRCLMRNWRRSSARGCASSRCPQLAHPGIDDGIAGAALLPGRKVCLGLSLRLRHRKCSNSPCRSARHSPGTAGPRWRHNRASPARPGRCRSRRPGHRVPHLRGRNLAEVQVRRKARGALDRGQVPAPAIAGRDRPVKPPAVRRARPRPASIRRAGRPPSRAWWAAGPSPPACPMRPAVGRGSGSARAAARRRHPFRTARARTG
jgi:hypothetical protein